MGDIGLFYVSVPASDMLQWHVSMTNPCRQHLVELARNGSGWCRALSWVVWGSFVGGMGLFHGWYRALLQHLVELSRHGAGISASVWRSIRIAPHQELVLLNVRKQDGPRLGDGTLGVQPVDVERLRLGFRV